MENIVDSCPHNMTEILESSLRLGCGQDQYGNDQYICVPNKNKTGLVELCYNGIMGIIEQGYCLETDGQELVQFDCSRFSSGCPRGYYRSNKIYQYPACQGINTEQNCYLAETSCPNNSWSTGTSKTTFDFQTTTPDPQYDPSYAAEIAGGLSAGVFLFVVILTTAVVLLRRRKNRKIEKQKRKPGMLFTRTNIEYDEDNWKVENETLLPEWTSLEILNTTEQIDRNAQEQITNKTDEQSDKNAQDQFDNRTQKQINNSAQEEFDNDTQDKGGKDRKMDSISHTMPQLPVTNPEDERTTEIAFPKLLKSHAFADSPFVGRHNAWKTKISDEFTTLTDDEVSVLFCFLCSDSGPPDLTDTEWLDMLNEIRQDVYDKDIPVTREEAQQILDRLKSRDYLWEDQEKITEDTKDETMYRIALRRPDKPFYYSSYDTANVYLRSGGYKRKPREKCVVSPGPSCDHLLVLRLQMNILTHVTMEDTGIYDTIHRILNIPENKIKSSKDERKEFLTELRREGEAVHYRGRSQDSVDHVTWLWRYGRHAKPDIVRSCIGLHPHWDIYIIDNKTYRKPSKILGYPTTVRCLLYCLLISDKYRTSLIEQSHRITKDKIRQRYFSDITDDGSVDPPDGITETRDGVMTFISDDIRHDVMYAFVTECLVEDSDLEFFLTTASRDVISEYCRSWDYKRSEGERCLYLPRYPKEMYDLFIDKLQLDIITHCTVSDRWIRDRISERLGVPREVLEWDQEARERYVEYAKRGTQTVHHARGMIVGCAGAGKTTLLKRLLGCSVEEIKEVKSTEGLEVHEEIFHICDQTKLLKGRKINKQDKNEESSATDIDAKTLTFFDFGGQCAYYACHQIYLTRRAFYVVVVDASKRLDQKVDKKVCDQDGSVFSGWTYGDYFVFWIKSIHTYCGSDNDKDPKPTILIVATHWEKENRQYQDKDALLHSLQQKLPKESNFSQYLVEKNCYCTFFPVQTLHEIQQCICGIASHQRWKENIPKEWAFFEIEINQKKESKRILDIEKLTTKLTGNIDKQQEGMKSEKDMLRYYHDAGKVLYFNEKGLQRYVVIDVQWFIDAFKHIITDKLHFQGISAVQGDWDEYYRTGHLRDPLLTEIWKHEDNKLKEKMMESGTREADSLYEIRDFGSKYSDSDFHHNPLYLLHHKKVLLDYLQRLGLMAVGEESHYVPCMNRKEIESAVIDLIKRSEKRSSILIYRFGFLPFFLFFRLVVSCMQITGWEVLITDETSCLYRNAALFSVHEYNVVLSVTETSIQLQIFHPVPGCSLEKDETYKIQNTIEVILNDISGTFHRRLMYERGFRCQEDSARNIAVDINGRFVRDRYIYEKDGEIICPLHPIINQHFINATELSKFWNLKKTYI
ncbi:uncharacterized protein LOC134259620 [Saccostrea cucullata]|uniref:uncharacterized protein LOC134259620 n=1 Tax=Saccostrea cuccullata TaxID=36930 RepID=UPI002ED094E8